MALNNGHKVGTGWPSWRYSKDNDGNILKRVCDSASDVPVGWVDNPDKLRAAEKTSVVVTKPEGKPAKLGSAT